MAFELGPTEYGAFATTTRKIIGDKNINRFYALDNFKYDYYGNVVSHGFYNGEAILANNFLRAYLDYNKSVPISFNPIQYKTFDVFFTNAYDPITGGYGYSPEITYNQWYTIVNADATSFQLTSGINNITGIPINLTVSCNGINSYVRKLINESERQYFSFSQDKWVTFQNIGDLISTTGFGTGFPLSIYNNYRISFDSVTDDIGINTGSGYWIINATNAVISGIGFSGTNFQLSLESGGASLDIPFDGSGKVSNIWTVASGYSPDFIPAVSLLDWQVLDPVYFYNRDNNILAPPLFTTFNFSPNYGSTVSFSCKKNKYMYNNNSFAIIPTTLNNIVATCNFNFNVNENDAQSIMNFFENQKGTGAFAVNDASQIYRTLTGFADDFSISMTTNNQYNIALNFSVERNSSVLNWSGMSFVNYDFVSWETGQFYQKYQPVYFEIQAQNKLVNFYYATEDHTSTASNAPPNTGYWSQSLFYENELGLTVETKPMVSRNEFKNSFVQRIKDSENIHSFQGLQLTYKNITDFKLKSILHFLENSLGYKRFQFNLPKIYNRPKLFYVDSWQHSWNYQDSNNLTISIVEDPLGIKVQDDVPAFLVGQALNQSSLSYYADPKSSAYVIDASGVKEVKTEGSQQINWGSYPAKNLKVYRELDSFSAYNQGVESVIFYPRCAVDNCDLSVNNINSVSFEGAKDVRSLNLLGNNLSTFSADGVTGLKNLNLSSNNLTSIGISGCNSLTGLNLNENQISQASFSTAMIDLANGSGASGNISVIGDISFVQVNPTPQSGDDYLCIASLDYRNWTQTYKNLSLPIQPTGFVGSSVFTAWLRDSFSGAVTNAYSAQWNSSQNVYPTIQNYISEPSNWATLNPNQFYRRPAYLFNNSLLTGGVINNTGDYLSAFVVAKFDNSGDQCILNFSPNKNYGLFYSGGTVSFRDGSTVNVLTGNVQAETQYYSIGFIRNSTHFTGYLNGRIGNSGTLSASNLNSIKLSVGGAEGATPRYFAGNLGEVLVFSNSSAFNLDSGFHKPFNARFGIFVP